MAKCKLPRIPRGRAQEQDHGLDWRTWGFLILILPMAIADVGITDHVFLPLGKSVPNPSYVVLTFELSIAGLTSGILTTIDQINTHVSQGLGSEFDSFKSKTGLLREAEGLKANLANTIQNFADLSKTKPPKRRKRFVVWAAIGIGFLIIGAVGVAGLALGVVNTKSIDLLEERDATQQQQIHNNSARISQLWDRTGNLTQYLELARHNFEEYQKNAFDMDQWRYRLSRYETQITRLDSIGDFIKGEKGSNFLGGQAFMESAITRAAEEELVLASESWKDVSNLPHYMEMVNETHYRILTEVPARNANAGLTHLIKYRALPITQDDDDNQFIVQPDMDGYILAVNPEKGFFGVFNQNKLDKCQKTGDFYTCKLTARARFQIIPEYLQKIVNYTEDISYIKKDPKVCIYSLYVENWHVMKASCVFEEAPAVAQLFMVAPNTFSLFSKDEEATLKTICNDTTSTQVISRRTVLKMDQEECMIIAPDGGVHFTEGKTIHVFLNPDPFKDLEHVQYQRIKPLIPISEYNRNVTLEEKPIPLFKWVQDEKKHLAKQKAVKNLRNQLAKGFSFSIPVLGAFGGVATALAFAFKKGLFAMVAPFFLKCLCAGNSGGICGGCGGNGNSDDNNEVNGDRLVINITGNDNTLTINQQQMQHAVEEADEAIYGTVDNK